MLTARFVETTKKAGKHFDAHGVFLRVAEGGSKKWVQRYTVNGKRREIGLGSAKVVTLARVREKAIENLRILADGFDPLGVKRASVQTPSFSEASFNVYELNKDSWKNKKHAAQFISTLETYAFPVLGSLKVNKIEPADIILALTPIWLQKPETARRVKQRISKVMKWSIGKGWREYNPCDSVGDVLPKQTKKQAHRKSISYDDVGNFITAIKASDAGIIVKLGLEFLILTATRSGEVRMACWSEINEDLWTIPSERMKAGVAHRVPLTQRCIDILEEAKIFADGSQFVFPGMRINRPLSENTFRNLINSLEYNADAHGFRTSFRTWTQEKTNYPREIAEQALAHSLKDKAEAAYARSDQLEKRRQMMQDWEDYILRKDADIIPIKA